ncbi:transmembrane protein, putative [Rhizoctonia solani AG-3 Rhs1AP]|uniref:Transmembrane protein, putative n=2 Tax=Rhizoctonia solani AG-3 TaxID=1086053 RepID=X8JDH9_9AGAM|nr:transmembrane protein, putative [Rhizoctonia solani AG-3 Rhs1AP]KEP53285.1 putative transmembrane protein [Rhizoctonia solani 123E]
MLAPLTPATNSNGELRFMNLTVFPNGGMRILSAMIHLVGSSILAYCVARRIKTVRVTSVNELKALSWPRVCVVLILVVSWLFVIGAGILIHGVGMATSYNSCSAGIFLCIWLYASSKVLIYAFLIEKVRVVWDVVAQPRLTSPVYLVCLFVVVPFCGVPILMVVGRIAFFREDMTCVIGLKPFSSLTLLVYDLCMNVFLNAMFLWPLLRSQLINPRLRAVARRTLVAAAAALATSIINIAILTAMKHQLGWVTLNAMVIFWVTLPMTDSPMGSHSARAAAQSSSFIKPVPDTPRTPAPPQSPIAFASQVVYAPRSSLAAVAKPSDVIHQSSPQAHDLRHASVLRGLPEFPSPPAAQSSSSVDILSTSPPVTLEDADKRPGTPDSNSSGRIHSLRKLFGLSKQKDQEVEVHVSVVTQQDVELGNLENGRAKRGDCESVQTEQSSKWFK